MKQTTLCFLLRKEKILLAMKKRGFGVGKWNGVGGKLLEGEDVKTAMVREIKEEIGVDVLPSDLKEMGTLEFHFEDNSDWDNYCHVFTTTLWFGESSESEEMRPQWYEKSALPFENMWLDDSLWLPLVLQDKKVQAVFNFNKDGSEIINSVINII
jgi:8-oxo-dGTP pyrophosphatase MutT (NUDIX family)